MLMFHGGIVMISRGVLCVSMFWRVGTVTNSTVFELLLYDLKHGVSPSDVRGMLK
jgi:hypothetical protein